MLVEGKFDLTAKGEPDDEGEYSWSFKGKGGGAFNPEQSDDGKTEFNATKITSKGSQSFINVKYSVADDKKEAKITRCEYFKRAGQNLIAAKEENPNHFTYLSATISKGAPDVGIPAFWAIFTYDLYDQYRKELAKSEKGGFFPYVKEKFMRKTWSMFLIPHEITKDWDEEEDCSFDDEIRFAVTFNHLGNENYVENFRSAIRWRIMWLASVQEGKHSKDTVEHLMDSYFIDVERSDGDKKELLSFKLQTEYIRVGALIK
jgi:hypothetical protein